MIKLIKIAKQYIIWAYTTDIHILFIGISLLQEIWRWHCYSHPTKLCLSPYQITFDYSSLKAHISKTTNDRNKWISEALFYLPLYYLKEESGLHMILDN